MNILIVGGTGVLSEAVSKQAIKEGISVTMINRGKRPERIPKGATLIKADLRNKEYIRQQLETKAFDAVLDFLCFTKSQIQSSFDFYSNYTSQYFFISSAAVIDGRVGGVLNEDSEKPLPTWNYSINKWDAEQFLVSKAQEKGVNYTIVRPCVTYDNTRIPYGIMPPYGYHWTLIARILNDKPVITWNEGANRCNMMRVEDFAVGVVGLIGNKAAYNQAFNVCGDESPSFNEVLNCISRRIGKEIVRIDIPTQFYAEEYKERKGEIIGGRGIDSVHSNAKLKSVVHDFKQTISLEQGLNMTIDSYINNGYQKGIDWDFDANTDRIIAKWCKEKGIKGKFNIKFIDYLNSAKTSDRYYYEMIRHRDGIIGKTCIFLYKICRRLSSYVK